MVKGLTKESSFQEAGPGKVVDIFFCFETMVLFEDVFFGKKKRNTPKFFSGDWGEIFWGRWRKPA